MKNEHLFKIWLGILALIGVLLFTLPVKAQQVVQIATIVCDEKQQLTDFMELLTKGEHPQSALDAVNKAAKKELACGFANATVIMDTVEAITVNGKRAEVAHVTILPIGLQQWVGRFLDKLATFRDA